MAFSGAARADPLHDAVAADLPALIAIYQDLHAHPELSFKEVRSSAILAAEARRAGFNVSSGIGGTGVVAVLKNGPGPVVLLRADMDALPATEANGPPFKSQVPGVMHACGHDTHMATWIGTARRLAAMKDRWSGTLVMIGQPAEEVGGGARAMLRDGLFTRFPKPDTIIAFHDSASLPAGQIGLVDGYILANVDSVDILVRGKGGHGAYPNTTIDPVVLGARIVTSLQTLVSREIDPLQSGVVTVGSFQSGTKRNIIPAEAKLQLTVRSYDAEVRRHLLEGLARIARGEAIAAGVPDSLLPVVTPAENSVSATFNTHLLLQNLQALFVSRFGPGRVVTVKPQMAEEDFGEYLQAAPSSQSALFWVGGVPEAKWNAAHGDPSQLPSLHSPDWEPDAKEVIATAVEAMSSAALASLSSR